MPKGDRLVNMRLDAETKELLRRLAEAEKRSMTAEIGWLVRERARGLGLLPDNALVHMPDRAEALVLRGPSTHAPQLRRALSWQLRLAPQAALLALESLIPRFVHSAVRIAPPPYAKLVASRPSGLLRSLLQNSSGSYPASKYSDLLIQWY